MPRSVISNAGSRSAVGAAGSNVGTHARRQAKSNTGNFPTGGGGASPGNNTLTNGNTSLLGSIDLRPDEEDTLVRTLRKYDEQKRREEERLKRLRSELVEIHRDRLKKATRGDEACSHCGRQFMPLFNQAKICRICLRRVDSACTHRAFANDEVLCNICFTDSQYKGKSGQWFNEQLRVATESGRVRALSGVDCLRRSMRRIERQRSSQVGSVLNGSQGGDNDRPGSTRKHSMNNMQGDEVFDPDSGLGQDPAYESPLRRIGAINNPNDDDMGSAVMRSRGQSKVGGGFHKRNASEVGTTSNLNGLGIKKFGSTLSLAGTSLSRENRGGSMISTANNSDCEEMYNTTVSISGHVQLVIDYNLRNQQLKIIVERATGLAACEDKTKSSNPYFKLLLLPDKSKAGKRKTTVKKHTTTPEFGEVFNFKISESDLRNRTFHLSGWHHSSGQNVFLGELILPMAGYQFDPAPKWFGLKSRRHDSIKIESSNRLRGEITLALKFETSTKNDELTGDLSVWVKGCSMLNSSSHESVSAFVKVYLLPDRKVENKRKTKVVKNQYSPDWNTVFLYEEIDKSMLASMGLEVSVHNTTMVKVTANEFLGGVRLSTGTKQKQWMDSVRSEQGIWKAMIDRPNVWIEAKLKLRSSFD